MNKKQQILAALSAFVAQRSGIDFRNYQSGDWKQSRECFMGDYRPILKRGKQARAMIQFIAGHDSITAEMILAGTRAYSGRLQIVERDGKIAVDYCTGQYFPTEYRAAACAVLSSVIWQWWSDHCLPEGQLVHNSETGETFKRYNGLRAGDYIRKRVSLELGRSIAKDWFN